ncbi:MAG: decaprenyl-phosphate phosphoribosyltransferase [Chloroflexota bacterium]
MFSVQQTSCIITPMKTFTALIKTMRPHQWIKNGFLFAALIFDRQLTNLPAMLCTVAGSVIFCLLSGSVYIVNDLIDLEADRNHPTKRSRPLPSGQLPISLARTTAVLIPLLTLPLAMSLSWSFGLISMLYMALNLSYSRWFKHIPILDVLILASFYVLRVGAGVALIEVERFSPWLYVFTIFLALFLGIGKRRAELALLAENANAHRRVLEGYTIPLLDHLITIVTGITIVTYSLYTFSAPNLPTNHAMMLTIPFVIYGIFRYLYLIHVNKIGGAPENVLFTDRPLQIDLALWGIAILIIFYIF